MEHAPIDEYDENASDNDSAAEDHLPKVESDGSPSGVADSADKPAVKANLQKRRRVTRACDECRRKKIKCDGKQPCTHCTVYSYGKYFGLRQALAGLTLRQSVPMINPRTAGGIQRRNMWRT